MCDRPLTRQVDRALATPAAESAGAWAAADRRVDRPRAGRGDDEPPALVYTSERTGNVQNHLMWFTLLDQMWVR